MPIVATLSVETLETHSRPAHARAAFGQDALQRGTPAAMLRGAVVVGRDAAPERAR
jgi:hypothetical protein